MLRSHRPLRPLRIQHTSPETLLLRQTRPPSKPPGCGSRPRVIQTSKRAGCAVASCSRRDPMDKPWAKAPLPQPVPIGSNREAADSVFGSTTRNTGAGAESAGAPHRVRIPVAVPCGLQELRAGRLRDEDATAAILQPSRADARRDPSRQHRSPASPYVGARGPDEEWRELGSIDPVTERPEVDWTRASRWRAV